MAYEWRPLALHDVGFQWEGGFYFIRKYSYIEESNALEVSYYVYKAACKAAGSTDIFPYVDFSCFPGICSFHVLNQQKTGLFRVWNVIERKE